MPKLRFNRRTVGPKEGLTTPDAGRGWPLPTGLVGPDAGRGWPNA